MRSSRAIEQYRQNQAVISYHHAEITSDSRDRRWRRVTRFARFAKEEQDHKEHSEHTERRKAVNILDTQMTMGPGREIGTGGAADVDQGVVNRVSDRADILF